jgi:Tol biopolymer transport system component
MCATAAAWLLLGAWPCAASEDPMEPWRSGAWVHPVAPTTNRHVIHSYFNTCPESPDGKYVLYYTSGTPEGEEGDLRVLERATGKERIVATGIHTEDAHRVACQQWCNDGKTIAYHDCRDGRWFVIAIDLASGKEKILAEDRQIGYGSETQPWVPIYGCHWNPGPHRDLELVNVTTGEIRVAVTAAQVVQEYGDWMKTKLGSADLSIFFPILSPDGKKVFFKPNVPSYRGSFRGMDSSKRDGKIVFDLEKGKLVRLAESWGHPSWTPDSRGIMEKGNAVLNVETGKNAPRFAPSCFSDHPSMSPDGKLFVTDADVTKRPYGKPGLWAIGVGPTQGDDYAVIYMFDNSHGATTWRHNHPHPHFSADGKRIYFNVNEGQWTQLMVAEVGIPAKAP